ncbi:hypothetical protein HanPSC8_Chr08g0308951 [Helianthus annuus]|nr:hypothetical protein HanPSC8_Chr08g0308951 [Helianthus annuus]
MIKHKHAGLLSFISFTESQHFFCGAGSFPVAKSTHVITAVTFVEHCCANDSSPAPTPPHATIHITVTATNTHPLFHIVVCVMVQLGFVDFKCKNRQVVNVGLLHEVMVVTAGWCTFIYLYLLCSKYLS